MASRPLGLASCLVGSRLGLWRREQCSARSARLPRVRAGALLSKEPRRRSVLRRSTISFCPAVERRGFRGGSRGRRSQASMWPSGSRRRSPVRSGQGAEANAHKERCHAHLGLRKLACATGGPARPVSGVKWFLAFGTFLSHEPELQGFRGCARGCEMLPDRATP